MKNLNFEKPELWRNLNFGQSWTFEKTWSINNSGIQWKSLSHGQLINKETSILFNQHFARSTFETNILWNNDELWIMNFLKCSFEHSSLARPSCKICSPGRHAIEMLLNILRNPLFWNLKNFGQTWTLEKLET